MKINNKLIKILMLAILALFILEIRAFAGSFSVRASETTVEPGSTITIYVTGESSYGKINLKGTNIALDGSSVWVDENTQSVTGKVIGQDGEKATITATPEEGNLVDSNDPEQVITGNKSITINIKKKDVPPPVEEKPDIVETPTNTTPSKPANNNPPSKTPSTKTQNTPNLNKSETINPAEDIKEDNEDQNTISEFGITSLYIFGVKENGEKIELTIFPEFDINTFEYDCIAESDIVRIEMEKEANEYSNLVKVEGIENPLQPGENLVKITMDDNQGNKKEYILTVNKEELSQITNNIETPKNKTLIFTIPQFVILQLSIIVAEILIVLIICKIKMQYKKGKTRFKED